jgi:hypothetical protein
MKKCIICGATVSSPHWYKGPNCSVCYEQERTRLKGLTRGKERRDRATVIIRSVRAIMGCQACKETDPVVLEMHHVIPIGKDRNRSFQSLTILEDDMALCTVVCANCHLRIAANAISSPLPMGKEKAQAFVLPYRKKTTYRHAYNHANARFTIEKVRLIRSLRPAITYTKLAARFKVSKATIVNIVKGHTYPLEVST